MPATIEQQQPSVIAWCNLGNADGQAPAVKGVAARSIYFGLLTHAPCIAQDQQSDRSLHAICVQAACTVEGATFIAIVMLH